MFIALGSTLYFTNTLISLPSKVLLIVSTSVFGFLHKTSNTNFENPLRECGVNTVSNLPNKSSLLSALYNSTAVAFTALIITK